MNKYRLLLSKIYRFFFPIDEVTKFRRMGVKIGDGTKIQGDVIIDYSHYWLIEIGKNVTLAPRVHILAHDASTKRELGYAKLGVTTIGDDVFVGANSIILPGVTIGAGSILGGLVGGNWGTISYSYATGNSKNVWFCAGGLVGWQDGGKITNSYATGNSQALDDAGGLVGWQTAGTVTKSFATGNSEATRLFAGGLVGYATHTSGKVIINNSYSTGTVKGGNDVGAFIGMLDNNVNFENSYVLGEVITGNKVIGRGGTVSGKISGLYYNVDTTRASSCSGAYCGDIGGLTTEQMQVSKGENNIYKDWSEDIWCFNDGRYPVLKDMPAGAPDASSCGAKTSCGGGSTGTYDECICKGNFVEYNPMVNECVWHCPTGATGQHPTCDCSANEDTPCYDEETNACTTCDIKTRGAKPLPDGLGGCKSCADENPLTPDYDEITGTCVTSCPIGQYLDENGLCRLAGQTDKGNCDAGYIAITTAEELAKIGHDDAYSLADNYCLMNDISLSAYQSGEGWEPIGYGTSFEGVFDGNNNKIIDLSIDDTSSHIKSPKNIGLFAYISNAEIKNLSLTGKIIVKNHSSVGGLVGYVLNSSIENVSVEIDIDSDTFYAIGGLAGYVESSSPVKNCHTSGKVISKIPTKGTGGLVGFLAGNIVNSYSDADVESHGECAGVMHSPDVIPSVSRGISSVKAFPSF